MTWRASPPSPSRRGASPQNPPHNTVGMHRVMFAVGVIDDVVARLRAHGAELVGELARYDDSTRVCYVRGRAELNYAHVKRLPMPPPWRLGVRGVIEARQKMSPWDVENPSAAPSPE